MIVRKIHSDGFDEIKSHLLRLAKDDRELRFGYAAKDEHIEQYVSKKDPMKTLNMGFFYEGSLVALVEVYFDQSVDSFDNQSAEIGLSVEPNFRGKGLGSILFEYAVTFSRNRGAKLLRSQCLMRNTWMRRIAISHNMVLDSSYGESVGEMLLSPPTPETFMQELSVDGKTLSAILRK